MIRPIVEGVLLVDISRHVDRYGMLTREGITAAWGAIAPAPAGIPIRLRIGALKSIGDLAYQLGDAGIGDAYSIEVEGSDPDGVRAVVQALCGIRDSRRAG